MPKFKRDSCFKLVVYYKNQGTRTYYSRDWSDEKYGKVNPALGLARLERYLQANLSMIDTALIYDKRTVPDQLVRKFTGGALIFSCPVHT